MIPVVMNVASHLAKSFNSDNVKFVASPTKVYALYLEGIAKLAEIKEQLTEFKEKIEMTISKPLWKTIAIAVEDPEDEKSNKRNKN